MEGSTQSHIEPRPPLRVQLTEEGPARPFVHVGLGTAVESLSECPKGNIVPWRCECSNGFKLPRQERLGSAFWLCMVSWNEWEDDYPRRLRSVLRHSQS